MLRTVQLTRKVATSMPAATYTAMASASAERNPGPLSVRP